MSIKPVGFTSGGITVIHDEMGHGGVVPFSDLRFVNGADGNPNRQYIAIACPVAGCDSVSIHPIGGGAAPVAIQRLFAHILKRAGTNGQLPLAFADALGLPDRDVSTWARAKEKVRFLANRMDGPGRFQIDDVHEDDP